MTEVISAQLSYVLPTLERDPSLWAHLILGAVVTPEEGIESMRAAGSSFSEIYFSDMGILGRDLSGTPLVGSVNSAVGQASQDLPLLDVEIAKGVASLFLDDFWTSDGARVVQQRSEFGHGLRPHLPTPAMVKTVPLSQSLVDFQLLSSIALFELNESAGTLVDWVGEGPSPRAIDPSDLDVLGLSPRVSQFARAWLADKTTFFSSIG